VIGGWRPGRGRRATTVGALLLGVYDLDGQLRYIGDVGTGFTERSRRDLPAVLETLERHTSPFRQVPREFAHGARWAEPHLAGEVEHHQLSAPTDTCDTPAGAGYDPTAIRGTFRHHRDGGSRRGCLAILPEQVGDRPTEGVSNQPELVHRQPA
jgi:hypothetical protein